MATTVPSVNAPTVQTCLRGRSPLGLWHLFSIDAPTVAVVWTSFLARANHVSLPTSSLFAMFLAVWTLYAADRLLDGRMLDRNPAAHTLELRHHFHHHYRTVFLIAIGVACAMLAVLLRRLPAVALHLYLVEGAFLAAYFLLIHATSSAHRLPKELAVGPFFAGAVFIPTISRFPSLQPQWIPGALLLAALCMLNCLFIFDWEHEPSTNARTPVRAHATTRLAVRYLALLVCLVAAGSVLMAAFHRSAWPMSLSVGLSALLLLALHRNRKRLAPETLRASADLALLTPLLLLPFLP